MDMMCVADQSMLLLRCSTKRVLSTSYTCTDGLFFVWNLFDWEGVFIHHVATNLIVTIFDDLRLVLWSGGAYFFFLLGHERARQ